MGEGLLSGTEMIKRYCLNYYSTAVKRYNDQGKSYKRNINWELLMVSGSHRDKKQTRGTKTVTEIFDPGLQTTSRLDLAWIFEISKPTSSNIHPPARVQLLQKTTHPQSFPSCSSITD